MHRHGVTDWRFFGREVADIRTPYRWLASAFRAAVLGPYNATVCIVTFVTRDSDRTVRGSGTPVSTGNGFDNFPLITPDEVAKLFRISKASVYRWAERGLLPAVKVGRTVRFNRQDVEQLIKTPVPHGLSPKAG